MKKRSPYVSNLPPKENKEDPIPWTCRVCNEVQNKDGKCANIANFLCPKCWNKKLHEDANKEISERQ